MILNYEDELMNSEGEPLSKFRDAFLDYLEGDRDYPPGIADMPTKHRSAAESFIRSITAASGVDPYASRPSVDQSWKRPDGGIIPGNQRDLNATIWQLSVAPNQSRLYPPNPARPLDQELPVADTAEVWENHHRGLARSGGLDKVPVVDIHLAQVLGVAEINLRGKNPQQAIVVALGGGR